MTSVEGDDLLRLLRRAPRLECGVIMACASAGERERGLQLYKDLQRFQVEDGSWWTGYVFKDDVHWPDERPSWTAAAIMMAADALFELTPAHHIFKHHD